MLDGIDKIHNFYIFDLVFIAIEIWDSDNVRQKYSYC